jgi:hypothetical protein
MASSGGSPTTAARSSASGPQKQQGQFSGFDDVFKGPAVQCSKEPPTLSGDKHSSSAGGFFTKHAAGEKAKQACDQSVWNRLALTGERSKAVRTLLSLSKVRTVIDKRGINAMWKKLAVSRRVLRWWAGAPP